MPPEAGGGPTWPIRLPSKWSYGERHRRALKVKPIALDEINDENDTNANNAHAHDERLSYFNRLNPLRESIYQPANNGVTKQSLSKNRR